MLNNFLLSLEIMWKGMTGIFVIIILITLIVMLLSKIPSQDHDSN
ncbi:MAG: hypothetical protein JG775_2495 [Defluviitaleaceae bacterium]|jgi:hypothetical protein|nr:hypothetical protein [Defluviitalea raffinosedens]MBZ4669342.1 hypothetical protein [Defluviitaleaceae bacterium]